MRPALLLAAGLCLSGALASAEEARRGEAGAPRSSLKSRVMVVLHETLPAPPPRPSEGPRLASAVALPGIAETPPGGATAPRVGPWHALAAAVGLLALAALLKGRRAP